LIALIDLVGTPYEVKISRTVWSGGCDKKRLFPKEVSTEESVILVVENIPTRNCKWSNLFVGCKRESLIKTLVSERIEGEGKNGKVNESEHLQASSPPAIERI